MALWWSSYHAENPYNLDKKSIILWRAHSPQSWFSSVSPLLLAVSCFWHNLFGFSTTSMLPLDSNHSLDCKLSKSHLTQSKWTSNRKHILSCIRFSELFGKITYTSLQANTFTYFRLSNSQCQDSICITKETFRRAHGIRHPNNKSKSLWKQVCNIFLQE